MKHLTIVFCLFAVTGCIGPLWPKSYPGFPKEYRSIEQVGLFRPEVHFVLEDPSGDTEPSGQILDDTADGLLKLVEKELVGRGYRVTALDPRPENSSVQGDPALESVRDDYLALSSKVMPQERVLSAAERLIFKQRYDPPVRRRVELGAGVGLGADAVAVAKQNEVDALFFVQLNVVYRTDAAYRMDTPWGAALPEKAVKYAERVVSPDHFVLRLALIDGETGAILWAYSKARETGRQRPTVEKRLSEMLESLPARTTAQ